MTNQPGQLGQRQLNPYFLGHIKLVMENLTNPDEGYEMSVPTGNMGILELVDLYRKEFPEEEIPVFDPAKYKLYFSIAKRGSVQVPGYNEKGKKE